MHKLTILAAAIAALTSTVGMAQNAPSRRFVRDGVTYVYTATAEPNGHQRIDGRAYPGSPFHLVVADGRVTGRSNGAPVAFPVSATTGY